MEEYHLLMILAVVVVKVALAMMVYHHLFCQNYCGHFQVAAVVDDNHSKVKVFLDDNFHEENKNAQNEMKKSDDDYCLDNLAGKHCRNGLNHCQHHQHFHHCNVFVDSNYCYCYYY